MYGISGYYIGLQVVDLDWCYQVVYYIINVLCYSLIVFTCFTCLLWYCI